MHKSIIGIAFCLCLLWRPGAFLASQADAAPVLWPTASPESQGFSPARLQTLSADLLARGTTAFLVIRNDNIIFETYAAGYNRTKPHGTASLAKAVVGGTSLMLLVEDGRIKPDDLASQYVPRWADDPLKSLIKICHLATHTSGIEDAEFENVPHDQLTGWKGDFWKRLPPPHDPFTIARDVAPVMEPPGTHERYSNPGMAMLSYCLTVALRGSTDTNLRDLLKHRILEPLGVPDSEWSVGYGGPISVDGLPLIASWGGAAYSPNALARMGSLLLHEGSWDGRQLISKEVVRLATSNIGQPNHSGLVWWVNRQPGGGRYWKDVPEDAFWGSGAGHQLLLVVPSLQLIVVRNGSVLDAKSDYNEALEKHLITPLMRALTSEYPPSHVIRQILWAPKDTIVRKANDSDNWPLTWADDDALYTAFGDGHGFEPFIPEKLSLGFAKVLGFPPDFAGINIRSATGEQLGGGSRGRKASGLLMVDGALYLWARNATNSQLACSTDHGVTWNWSDWKFTNSFGFPSFLNFGRNYDQARDGFVYVYSPDSDSAYMPADRLVLARVPKGQILHRDAYEYFLNLDDSAQPVWGRDFAHRGGVFQRSGGCYRPSVNYNPALKRYLMVMPIPNERSHDERGRIDTRSAGGLAIYDAPAPWGPWTTVFLTNDWDVGPGDCASFPAKWMSQDGQSLKLVFSGDDNFSVRQATFVPADSETAIRKRAKGFKDKTLAQAARIDATDGIDASEALAIAEWQIFGEVDLGKMRVLSYTQPSLQGEEWRIGVAVVTPQGAVDMPIYVDRITGYSHGNGWDNILIADTPIGRSRFRLDKRGEQIWLEVTLSRFTAVGDLEAKAECMKDTKAAIQVIRRGFGDKFQDVLEAEIKLTEGQVSDVRSDRDRSWHAEVLLRSGGRL